MMTRRTTMIGLAATAVLPTTTVSATRARAGAPVAEETVRRLHDRVRDDIAFGWTARFYAETPRETEQAGTGYCITKSALLVDRLRREGIRARMVFAEIDATLLSGLIDPGTPWADHAYVEVELDGTWIAFDSHVVDRPLLHAAQTLLRRDGRPFGLGVHAAGTDRFPGFSQFFPGPVRGRVWGSFETVEAFHRNAPVVWNRLPWVVRQAFGLFAGAANDRIAALRAPS